MRVSGCGHNAGGRGGRSRNHVTSSLEKVKVKPERWKKARKLRWEQEPWRGGTCSRDFLTPSNRQETEPRASSLRANPSLSALLTHAVSDPLWCEARAGDRDRPEVRSSYCPFNDWLLSPLLFRVATLCVEWEAVLLHGMKRAKNKPPLK